MIKKIVAFYFFPLPQVVNTTSDELSNVAIEASVWDLGGETQYHKVSEKLSVPSKRTASFFEMNYPKSESPKPVYFLLLKLYNQSDHSILSRNFYWLHSSGGDYKLLESYKNKKIPLKVTSQASIKGYTYQMRIQVENTSKKPNSTNLLKNCAGKLDNGEKEEGGLFKRIYGHFWRESNGLRVVESNGDEVGVAFFLHFAVHDSSKNGFEEEFEDTRILPVHYSDNYFSLVPGETMSINLSFEVPKGVTPQVVLNGWNLHGALTVY